MVTTMATSDGGFVEGQAARLRAFAVRLLAGVALANLVVICLAVLAVVQLRRESEARARVTAQNVSRMLDQNLDNLLDKIDITLLTVASEAEREQRLGGLDRPAMNAFLAEHHSRIPEIDNLMMADASGDVRFGADLSGDGMISVAQRDFFAAHRDRDGAGLVISRPFVGRLTGKWLVVISRRVNRPDGALLGVAWGAVSLDSISRLFATLDIGPTGGISLRDAEMGIIARHPAPADVGTIIGNKTLSPELREHFEAGRTEATFFTPSSWDQTAKIVSYRKIGRYPLFINVGIATADYLAGWRREAARLAALAGLFVLGSLLLSRALFARYRREKQAETDLHALNERLELRVTERTTELHAKNAQLEAALARVKQLEGIIPICMYCKKIRDDQNSWQQLETYITEHSEAMFTHGICPNCMKDLDRKSP